MNKQLRHFIFAAMLLLGTIPASAQRYLTEIFPTISRTPSIQYGSNYSFLSGTPTLSPLLMDVYEPDTLIDTQTARPLVVVLHTGSFLPPVINGQPTGSRRDSSIVEICSQFARRGYVAAAMSYRLGWNPAATGPAGQDIRTGTLLNAVYRAIQDAKACVRYFKADASVSNNFGIDTTKIILVGQGTGGYVVQGYAYVDKTSEINLPKFLSSTTDATYGFVAGQSYVNQAVVGDFDGFGGLPSFNNSNNTPGHTSDVHFIINMGGALGDSSWMEAGDAPLMGFHPIGDPFAPFYIGDVVVPTTGDFVVEVSGSGQAVERANQLGLNACMSTPVPFSDPYSVRANSINNGLEGLFPFYTNPQIQSGPWEWYDSTATVFYASFLPPPYNTQGGAAYSASILTNPDMSKAKALAYIDTIMGYSNPRIVRCLGITTGLNENLAKITGVKLMPNPADQQMSIVAENRNELIRAVDILDITGRSLFSANDINASNYTVDRNGIPSGAYLVKVHFDKGIVTLKAIYR
jgi:hypothetical protein